MLLDFHLRRGGAAWRRAVATIALPISSQIRNSRAAAGVYPLNREDWPCKAAAVSGSRQPRFLCSLAKRE